MKSRVAVEQRPWRVFLSAGAFELGATPALRANTSASVPDGQREPSRIVPISKAVEVLVVGGGGGLGTGGSGHAARRALRLSGRHGHRRACRLGARHDLRESRHFDDRVARLGACLLGYKLYDPNGLDYDLPYRCMVPRGRDGLLLAGRCVGSDYLANNTLRLIVPCFATGQAAGIAAALAVRHGVAPRKVPVQDLQDRLVSQGVYLAAAGQALAPLPGETAPIAVTDS